MTAPSQHEELSTGPVALIEDPAGTAAPAFGDEMLAGMANVLLAISDQLPPNLWTGISVYDRRHLRETLPDVEVHAVDVPAAQALAEHMPWAGPTQTYVQPGLQHDHFIWQGIVHGLRVRVVALQPLGGAS